MFDLRNDLKNEQRDRNMGPKYEPFKSTNILYIFKKVKVRRNKL